MSAGQDRSLGDIADARFARDASGRLRDAAQRLDPAIVARLDRARQAAVQAAGEPRRPAWLPVAVAAGIGTVALTLVIGRNQPGGPAGLPVVSGDAVPGDMDIVLAGDNLEMFEELEFYAWLTDQQDAG